MTLAEQHAAIVAALEPLKAEIDGLQIFQGRNQQPTPPALDVYPGDPFLVGAGMGPESKQAFWSVRARASSADQDAQQVLIRLLDPADAASVEAALDLIDIGVANDGYVTGFRDDTDGLVSCEWRVTGFM